MKSDFSRFLHRTLSPTDVREVFTSSLSLSDLIGESRLNKVANLSHLDYRIKFENDNIGVDYQVKFENDKIVNAGRSMVEMLGVLAIIGVLSVGAIAGYSKAMMKYKLNKQSEQLTQILFSLEHYREMLGRDRNNIAINSSIITLLTKLNAIPLEMIRPNDPDQIYDIFGNEIWLDYYGNAESPLDSYTVAVTYQPDQQDVCNNVFELIKANSEKLYSAGVKLDKVGTFASPILNAITINQITKSDIYDYCALCKSGPLCRVSANFNFD